MARDADVKINWRTIQSIIALLWYKCSFFHFVPGIYLKLKYYMSTYNYVIVSRISRLYKRMWLLEAKHNIKNSNQLGHFEAELNINSSGKFYYGQNSNIMALLFSERFVANNVLKFWPISSFFFFWDMLINKNSKEGGGTFSGSFTDIGRRQSHLLRRGTPTLKNNQRYSAPNIGCSIAASL